MNNQNSSGNPARPQQANYNPNDKATWANRFARSAPRPDDANQGIPASPGTGPRPYLGEAGIVSQRPT